MKEIIDTFKHVFLQNYATFSGRARRSEYWLFSLALYLISLLILVPAMLVAIAWIASSYKGSSLEESIILFVVIFLIVFVLLLATLIPSLAVGVRRLHDTNRSGWWFLLSLIPLGGVVIYVFLMQDSDEGFNDYGADPKEEERNYYRNLTQPTANYKDETPNAYTQNRLL